MVLGCQIDDEKVHPLTGSTTTLLEENFNGLHENCFLAAVYSTSAAMMVLLDNTDQLWICSLCR